MRIDLYIHNDGPYATLDDLKRIEDKMSVLSDDIAAATAAADSAIARVTAEITALQAQIATLQANPGATQADLDAITALKAKLDLLVNTPVPPPSAP